MGDEERQNFARLGFGLGCADKANPTTPDTLSRLFLPRSRSSHSSHRDKKLSSKKEMRRWVVDAGLVLVWAFLAPATSAAPLTEKSTCSAPVGGPDYSGSYWQCISFENNWVPVKKTAWQNAACMSADSKTCLWVDKSCCDSLVATADSTTPYLECGPAHKAIYGDDGYGPKGWCNKALEAFRAPTVYRDDLQDPTLSAAIAGAITTSFAEIAAPGAIVGVETAKGRWVGTIGTQEWSDLVTTRATSARKPMMPDLNQRIGSITKTFTVTVLLQLAEKGNLSLNDPIGKYVTGLPNSDATLYQLAAMRSGIPSYTFDTNFTDALFADPYKPWTPEQLIDVIRLPKQFDSAQGSYRPPGSQTFYSNTNTVLLGIVIEQVTGKPLHEVIRKQIIEPLGLNHTVFPVDSTFPDPHARGYTVQGQDDGLPADATDWNPSWGWSAGAMISSLDDLLHYGKALVSGDKLLGPEMQSTRLNSFNFTVPPNTPSRAYGLGIGLANGWYGHTGELPGFNTVLQRHPDKGFTLVVMANSDIKSGECPPGSPVLPNGITEGPCNDPAVHVANQISVALGVPLVV